MPLIHVDDSDADGSGGDATFNPSSILDPYDAGGAVTNVWTTVLDWDGTLPGTPALSMTASTNGWTQQIVANELQVCLDCVPVPEPGAISMAGDMGLLVIRRKKYRNQSNS